jgi:hypothetical protein
MSRKYAQPRSWSGAVPGQAVVDQADGGGAALLHQVDLDGHAPGRDTEAAILPAVGEDHPPVRDELDEPADDSGAVRVGPAQGPARWGRPVATGPTQRTSPCAAANVTL